MGRLQRLYRSEQWFRIYTEQMATVMRCMRVVANLTQADLASDVGTTQSGISDAERGDKDLFLSTLLRVGDACGYDIIVTVKRRDGLPLQSEWIVDMRGFGND